MGLGSLTFNQEPAAGDTGFFCLVSISCQIPRAAPPSGLGQLPSRPASHEIPRAGALTNPMAKVLAQGDPGRVCVDLGPRRIDAQILKSVEIKRASPVGVSGRRLGAKRPCPAEPSPASPGVQGGWQGRLVWTRPMARPASLHAHTHRAINPSHP